MAKIFVVAAGLIMVLALTEQAGASETPSQGLKTCYASMATLPETLPANADPATLFCFGVRALSRNPNDPAAAAYALPAAKAGYAPAQDMIAGLYEIGAGVPLDRRQALDWYHKAAEQGSPEAQNDYAVLLYDGWPGQEPQYAEAVKWLRKSADQGYPDAKTKLAEAYYNGRGVSRDLKVAFDLYSQAADLGELHAMYVLGYLYLSGEGVSVDEAAGARWLLKASERNSAESQVIMAGLYMTGTGVEANAETGLMWYEIAMKNGGPVDNDLADMLRKSLSVDKIAGVKSRAAAKWTELRRVSAPPQ